ncbi:MAG: hypothetical protein H0Z39_05510 [Peptococcaceae bacterium]|nr:hypothetical protein [Peptococcaceae bacterium]
MARLLVKEINRRMEETEAALGIDRVKPFELYVCRGQRQARLPLFCPKYLEPILAGGDFAEARHLVLKKCLKMYCREFTGAGKTDLLKVIDPWSLVRGNGPSRYVDELYPAPVPYDESDGAFLSRMIEGIRPLLPTDRLQAPDFLAPGQVLKELTEFVTVEAGLGPVVARQLVEEVIALRNICSAACAPRS